MRVLRVYSCEASVGASCFFLAFRVVRVLRVYSCEASVGASCFFFERLEL